MSEEREREDRLVDAAIEAWNASRTTATGTPKQRFRERWRAVVRAVLRGAPR